MSVLGASLFRYWQERRDADGEPLFWPGGPAGFPLRGKPRALTNEEYESLPLSFKFRSRTFYLDNEEDAGQYQDVCERIANALYLKQDRDRQWDPERGCYRIYLEWLEPGYMIPPSRSDVWPMEGQNNASTSSVLGGLDQSDPGLLVKLAGVAPGMQLEPVRRR
jgi:hypothetical protein